MISKVLLICSLVVFVLALFNVALGHLNMIALGLAFYVGSKLVP